MGVCEHRADDGENLSLFPAGEDPLWLMMPSLYHASQGGTVLSFSQAEKLHTLCPASSTTFQHPAAEEIGTQVRE